MTGHYKTVKGDEEEDYMGRSNPKSLGKVLYSMFAAISLLGYVSTSM